MGHSLGDGIIVASLAAALVAYLYFQYRRVQILHEERVAAMEKGVPLPELEPRKLGKTPDPRVPLLHGIVWLALGGGAMAALQLVGIRVNGLAIWPLPLPLALLGVGLILFYALATERAN